ncbi:MAG: helix-turn-helix domain-containing protein, partial [Thermoanaerobaculia bacterium]
PFRPRPEPVPEPQSAPEPRVEVPLDGDPEHERIRSALEAHQWRRTEAAEALGMSRTTLWRKMREHGLLK